MCILQMNAIHHNIKQVPFTTTTTTTNKLLSCTLLSLSLSRNEHAAAGLAAIWMYSTMRRCGKLKITVKQQVKDSVSVSDAHRLWLTYTKYLSFG